MAKHSKLVDDPAVLQSFLNDNIWGKRYYHDLFPLKFSPRITVKYRVADKGAQVAAEVTAFGAEAPLKSRETADVKFMDLSPIRVKRVMNEDDIVEYKDLLAQPQTPEKDIMDFIFDDVKFVYDAVEARREYLALRALGTFTISTTDMAIAYNPEMPLQTTIDYNLAAAHKRVLLTATTSRRWGTGSVSQIQPITDFQDIMNAAEDAGCEPPMYAIMNTTQWRQFNAADQVVDLAKPFNFNQAPFETVNAVNAALKSYGLPQVIVVNNRIRVERFNSGPNGTKTRTTVNPWPDNYVTFVPSLKCGDMLWTDPPAKGEEPDYVTSSYSNGILVSKWSEVDPIREFTKGEAVSFPVIPNVANMWKVNVTTGDSDGVE